MTSTGGHSLVHGAWRRIEAFLPVRKAYSRSRGIPQDVGHLHCIYGGTTDLTSTLLKAFNVDDCWSVPLPLRSILIREKLNDSIEVSHNSLAARINRDAQLRAIAEHVWVEETLLLPPLAAGEVDSLTSDMANWQRKFWKLHHGNIPPIVGELSKKSWLAMISDSHRSIEVFAPIEMMVSILTSTQLPTAR